MILTLADLQRAVEMLKNAPAPKYSFIINGVQAIELDKALRTHLIRMIGRHEQFRFENETWWEIWKLPRKQPFNVERLIRWNDDYFNTGGGTLPKAMRKHGYTVKNDRIIQEKK